MKGPPLREVADHYHLSRADYDFAVETVGSSFTEADLVIAPDGQPYLYRWHILKNPRGSWYFHIQVRDDPERPLHDHPWDNQSVIISGGYNEEIWNFAEYWADGSKRVDACARRAGATITRSAEDAHRLLMPKGVPYTMTLFSTGPNRRRWGFWYPEGWVDAAVVCKQDGAVSSHTRRED